MVNSYNWQNSIMVGPCSNRPAGDHEWSYKPNGGITEIKLWRGGVIDSITFKSIDEKGNIETSKKFGGDGGGIDHVISFNWPNEYLIKLSGSLATYAEFPGIGSLCFETNLKKYGPFGHTDGTPFEFTVKDGIIVGFHGRFGIYVNTIGIYIKHPAELFRSSSQVQTLTPKGHDESGEQNAVSKQDELVAMNCTLKMKFSKLEAAQEALKLLSIINLIFSGMVMIVTVMTNLRT